MKSIQILHLHLHLHHNPAVLIPNCSVALRDSRCDRYNLAGGASAGVLQYLTPDALEWTIDHSLPRQRDHPCSTGSSEHISETNVTWLRILARGDGPDWTRFEARDHCGGAEEHTHTRRLREELVEPAERAKTKHPRR